MLRSRSVPLSQRDGTGRNPRYHQRQRWRSLLHPLAGFASNVAESQVVISEGGKNPGCLAAGKAFKKQNGNI